MKSRRRIAYPRAPSRWRFQVIKQKAIEAYGHFGQRSCAPHKKILR
jgi:hypothetical protein